MIDRLSIYVLLIGDRRFLIPNSNCDMELEFKDPFLLSKILEIAKKGNVSDCLLVFDETSISTQSMDSSHISMINFYLDTTEVCNTYSFSSQEPLKVGISVENYLKVMKLVKKKNASVGLTIDVNRSDVITFVVKSDNNIFSFDMKLMDIEIDDLMIPPLEEHTQISFPIKTVTDLLGPVEGSDIELGISPEDPTSVLYCVKSETGTLFGKIIGGSVTFGEPQSVKLRLAMSCMKNYCVVPVDLASSISLVFKRDFPLVVRYEFGEKSKLELYIAPKIDDMEET